ncbi:alpha-N-acetylgalactosaminide alpha-2,6-sialyltransferase 5b [Notolabrus celidotus]|uniref:alpha-N-acetylgalactosaminide alpha-2,6-sialyltransferase 5b n=1 Tax=Notolabrus celidotus TaxID=1203425 RepID=UPI0014904859|nr:alpha-N-acetylgalactosaminide alpha-2,6-sialyltransferase 5b [Notolabrus celidotus]
MGKQCSAGASSPRADPSDAAALVLHAEDSRLRVSELWSRYDEGSVCVGKRGELKMKIRVCQGVSGIIIITMVTSIMLVYNNSFRDRSSSPSVSSLSSQRSDGPAPTRKPQRPPTSTLEGYTGVVDRKHLKMHCSTCALVTSSGQLTGRKRGEEIDRSECVIRMNDAPNIGYQKDVGQRTSLRVIAHSSLQRVLRSRQQLLNASQDTVFIFWGPSSCMRRDGKGHVYNNLRLLSQLLPRLKIYIISRIKMLRFDELFKKETGIDRKSSNSWLSTGWFTMAIALELCDRINVYGMVPPDYCRSSFHPSLPYHYYEPSGPNECSMYLTHERSRRGSHHRFITEKTVFANWARTFNIHFNQPDWKPAAVITSMNSSYTPVPAGS